MPKARARLVLACLAVTLAATVNSGSAPALAADAADWVGTWTGALDAGGTRIPLIVHVKARQGGKLKATLDSPDQGATDIPCEISVSGERIEIKVPAIQGTYTGTLDAANGRIDGSWTQAKHTLPLVLTRKEPAAAAETVAANRIDSQPHGAELPGSWLGTLAAGAIELRVQFNVTAEDGALAVTLDSIDQGAYGIAAEVELGPDRAVAFTVTAVGGAFEGALNAAGDTLTGHWAQGPQKLPLILTHSMEEFTLDRPQEPQPPFPYETTEVTFPGGADDVTLAGTLTMPPGDGPFPAAVLVSGSGPQNRDEELMGHKPFLVLADHLTRQGIAVLRYDDRGTDASTGEFSGATSGDFADDAEAAFDFLRGREKIRPDAVGIIGHSEGGLVAPDVAARRPEVGFIVLLAGPGVDGRRILWRQTEDLMRAAGVDEETIVAETAALDEIFAAAAEEQDLERRTERIMTILANAAQDDGETPNPDALRVQAEEYAGPWMMHFLFTDPAVNLRRVQCPVLALAGSLDLQVNAAINLGAIEAALAAGGNERVEIREFEGLNHLFQAAEQGTISEYGQISETMAPVVLETIAAWIADVAHGG